MTKTVLVVDDDYLVQETVKAVLEHAGYKVLIADSGSECLEQLKAGMPDLLIVDMMMPEMTGKELIEKIREKKATADAKVIVLTVMHVIAAGKKDMERLKVADYINKPFKNEDFVARVKKVVGG